MPSIVYSTMANQEKEGERTNGDSHVLGSDGTNAEAGGYHNDKIRPTPPTKERIAGKIKSMVLGEPEGENIGTLPLAVRISNNIRTILLSLFTLIGFIVLVYAVFTASVGAELAQTAATVFMAALIAAIIGAFALLGVVLYPIRGQSKTG
jgi:hypothetical protein